MEEHNKSNAEEGTSAATEELSPEEQKKARAYIKRQYVVDELIDTERSYVDKLRSAISNYLIPIKEEKLEGTLHGKDIKEVAVIIFGNMEAILKFHEEVFLPALLNCDNSVDQIVGCFLEHSNEFKLYTNYILGRSKAEPWMTPTKEFLEERRKQIGDKVRLQSYTISPVQRFTKYQLLLKDMVKYTQYAEEDSSRVKAAYQLMTTLPQEANDIVSISMIKGLQHDLLGHGQLRHRGQLLFWDSLSAKKPIDVLVYLFDFRLIITEPQDESGFCQYKTDCLLTNSVSLIEDWDNDPLHWAVAYKEKETGEERYFNFISSSIITRKEWLDGMKKVLHLHEKLAYGLKVKVGSKSPTNGMPRSKTSSEVFSNSSLEEMSSSDPDEDVPSSQGYRPLPKDLRSRKVKIANSVSKKQLSILPSQQVELNSTYQFEKGSLTPVAPRKAAHRESSTGSTGSMDSGIKKRMTFTPKTIMRSIVRASVVAGKRNKTRKSTSEAGHKPRQTGETVPKSVSGFFENETNVSSSDEDDEIQVSGSQMNGSPRHVVAPSARFESAIFIGRDDITPEAEKTHILTALPGMIYEVRDRFSGSDFWYVKVLGESEEGQKREGWIKARHLKPYQAPFSTCESSELYKLQKEVASGRFSVEKNCLSLLEPAQYVAKIMSKNETNLNKFAFELNIGFHLKHPNLVRSIEGIEEKNNYIIILERVAGRPLLPYILDKEYFQESDVAHYMKQLCSALSYLHKRFLVHQDVRPENVLVSNERVKLCDFGGTRYTNTDAALNASTLKLENEAPFNSLYSAPEVFAQTEITSKTDMWSIGLLTYLLIFGDVPFRGDKKVDTVALIMAAEPKLDGQLVSSEVLDFMESLLQRQPTNRLSAEEALASQWLSVRNIYVSAKLNISKLQSFYQSIQQES